MIIAVTGSSGTLGRATVERLRADGHDVVGFDLAGPAGPGFTRVDLSDYGQTLDAILGVTARHDGLDALVHLAAVPVNGLIPDVATFENNLAASSHVLFAAHRAGIRRIVIASSITAAGFPFDVAPPALPVDEGYTRAFNTYGLGKVVEETLAAQIAGWREGVSITALRFTNVVAPDGYATFARAGEDDYRRDLLGSWVDARDGAEADLRQPQVAARHRFARRLGGIDGGIEEVSVAHHARKQTQLADRAATLALQACNRQTGLGMRAFDERVAQIENRLRHGENENIPLGDAQLRVETGTAHGFGFVQHRQSRSLVYRLCTAVLPLIRPAGHLPADGARICRTGLLTQRGSLGQVPSPRLAARGSGRGRNCLICAYRRAPAGRCDRARRSPASARPRRRKRGRFRHIR